LGGEEERIVVGRMTRPIYPRFPSDMLTKRNERKSNRETLIRVEEVWQPEEEKGEVKG
jgi:hypothetical protein